MATNAVGKGSQFFDLHSSTMMLVETVDTTSNGCSQFGNHFRLECPHFDREDFFGWIMKLEQFFEAKVRLIMM